MGGTQCFIVALIFISLIIRGTEYLSLNIWESVCSVNSLSVLTISLLYCSLIFFLWLVKMLYPLKKFVLGWWGIENISLGWFYLLSFVLPCRVFFKCSWICQFFLWLLNFVSYSERPPLPYFLQVFLWFHSFT